MNIQRALLVALWLAAIAPIAAPAYAQRHGRPDGIQTYARSSPPQELEIQWPSRHQLNRWRYADLEALSDHTVTVPPSKHSASEAFSGVPLIDVLETQSGADSDGVLIEVHIGWFRKKILHWQALDLQQTILATRRHGDLLQDGPWLIAVDTHGQPMAIKSVTRIVVKTSPDSTPDQ